MRSVDECRDWLAADEGWKRKGDRWKHPVWHKLGSGQKRHHIPATLDAAAAAMPEGWWWLKSDLSFFETWWLAGRKALYEIKIRSTGNELADRFNLAVLVREKIKENKQ